MLVYLLTELYICRNEKGEVMKLRDAIEQMFYEDKPIGVRCKLCGELLTYSAMNVADDPYGVKEHYKELHQDVDIELIMLNASFNRMAEDGFKRELSEMRKRTDYEGPIIVSSSFGESSWYRDMLNKAREQFRNDDGNLNAEVSRGKFIPRYMTFCQGVDDTPAWFIKEWCKSDNSKDVVMEQLCKDGEVYLDGKSYFERMCNCSFDEIDNKLFSDMKDKEKISDNPYEGGTLYSVLRDRILEKKKLPANTTIPNDNMVRELLQTSMEELVPMLVQHELEKANAKFPPFASDMEGWAVLKEEIEEADEELVNIKRWHDQIWIAIRGNRKFHSDYIRLIGTLAQRLMVEAAQVAAMAAKYEAMLERNEKKEE